MLLGLLSHSLHSHHVLHQHVLWCRPHRVVSEMRLGLLILKNDYISVKTADMIVQIHSYASLLQGTSDSRGMDSDSSAAPKDTK